MNNYNYISLTFVMLTLLFACNKSNNDTSFSTNEIVKTDLGEYRVFKNEKHGYKINIPLAWQYKFKKNTILIAQNPKGNKTEFRETMDVVKVEGGFTMVDGKKVKKNKADLNEFFKNHLQDLSKTDFDTEVEGTGEKMVNGRLAKWAVFKDKKDRHAVKVIKYFYSSKEDIYIVSGSMMDKDFATQGPVFNDIAESFDLL